MPEDPRHSSRRQTWRTPPEFFDRMNAEFRFVLDAAAKAVDRKTQLYIGPDHFEPHLRDALALADWNMAVAPWLPLVASPHVWCNPPYGKGGVQRWIEKFWEQAQLGMTVVGLTYARTETIWFHEIAMRHATELRFVKGRIDFLDPDTGEPGGSPGGANLVSIWTPQGGPPRITTMDRV